MRALALPTNTPRSFYRGAGRIHRFRGIAAPPDPYFPEDWIGSTTTRFGEPARGLSRLPDGRTLADAVAAEPELWLGPEHVQRFGADPAVLVKLLDAGQRLPLHVHPDRSFARAHLTSPYGKTEAWVIVEAAPDAVVHLGFARTIEPAELAGWVATQQIPAMLEATNRIPVRAGDAIVVPAGLPHAIGDGIFLVEVQEPTDFSVLLETASFDVDPAAAFLGVDRDLALSCVDRGAWSGPRLAELSGVRAGGRRVRPGVDRLFPELADEFFAAERLVPDPVSVVDAGFSVIVVVAGEGLYTDGSGAATTVARGDTLLVPYAAGNGTLTGTVTAIRCRPALSGRPPRK
jgi:mannose-6-phosphate isomerase